MKFYRPILCGETGFWGGAFCCVAPSLKVAFKMLDRRIASGKVKKVPYAR